MVALLRGYLQHLLHSPLSGRRLMATPRRMLVLDLLVVACVCVCVCVCVRVNVMVLCVCVRMVEVCFMGGLVPMLVALRKVVLNVRKPESRLG